MLILILYITKTVRKYILINHVFETHINIPAAYARSLHLIVTVGDDEI